MTDPTGSTLYCGDNCNHTGPHVYPPSRPEQAEARASLDVERLARALFTWDRSEHTWVTEDDWPLAALRWRPVAATLLALLEKP